MPPGIARRRSGKAIIILFVNGNLGQSRGSATASADSSILRSVGQMN